MEWIKVRNQATGGEATVPESALREMVRAGWEKQDDPEPPQEPESKPASKRSRKAADQADQAEQPDQGQQEPQEQPAHGQEGN